MRANIWAAIQILGAIGVGLMLYDEIKAGRLDASPRFSGWAHVAKAPCQHPSVTESSSSILVACPDGHVWEYVR